VLVAGRSTSVPLSGLKTKARPHCGQLSGALEEGMEPALPPVESVNRVPQAHTQPMRRAGLPATSA
jgi:hypothetical protein